MPLKLKTFERITVFTNAKTFFLLQPNTWCVSVEESKTIDKSLYQAQTAFIHGIVSDSRIENELK